MLTNTPLSSKRYASILATCVSLGALALILLILFALYLFQRYHPQNKEKQAEGNTEKAAFLPKVDSLLSANSTPKLRLCGTEDKGSNNEFEEKRADNSETKETDINLNKVTTEMLQPEKRDFPPVSKATISLFEPSESNFSVAETLSQAFSGFGQKAIDLFSERSGGDGEAEPHSHLPDESQGEDGCCKQMLNQNGHVKDSGSGCVNSTGELNNSNDAREALTAQTNSILSWSVSHILFW
ncbi:unnamed protein product [Protopolystoma xenopodis]|uniref:Uncharacterized protein n=1 Tax=Protopolystoma xenopodis TaxID=117903 RepID=A0A3S5B7F3_9PLAT|nr:unnamed protein product [Protopolystoma xenopodis]